VGLLTNRGSEVVFGWIPLLVLLVGFLGETGLVWLRSGEDWALASRQCLSSLLKPWVVLGS
jgi:hypothetical protein